MMQYGPKRIHNFSTILSKSCNENKPEGVFLSVFSYGKLRGSSLTYFPVFVVMYLKLLKTFIKCLKAHFSLATSLK